MEKIMETYTAKYHGVTFEIQRYPREKMEELQDRVRLGNKKLNEAWEVIKKMPHGSPTWAKNLNDWHLANVRLSAYCSQLENMGFRACLYIKDGKKYRKCMEGMGCRVCPSQISYWEGEFMDMPSASEEQGAFKEKK